VYFLTFGTDGKGGVFAEDRVLAEIRAAANAPLFGALSPEIGHGIVGGSVMNVERLADTAADVAIRLLAGESPASVRTSPQKTGPPVFDWRELRRWQVDEGRLPPGSVVRFRAPGVWDRFKWGIVGGTLVLIAQTLLIGTLLVSRAKRRQVERLLRDNVADLDVARGSLSNLSRSLMEAQEQERTRVARELHDDVSQRLSFLAMDLARLAKASSASAADTRAQAQSLYDAVVALGRDVQGISHRLHSSNVDRLGLAVAARGFCTDVASRHDLDLQYVDEGVPGCLPDGVAIGLFRVLQEALSNTLKHAGARHCRVVLRGSEDAVHLQVVDDGRGFETDAVRKGPGLGLISMRERLKLVNGTVTIESTVGSGTVVLARVPLQAPAAPDDQAVSSSAVLAVRSTTA
jgi:signal transduction histidine kinase